MAFSSLLIFAAALAVVASAPGPSVAALVTRVLVHGHREVLPFLAAMWIAEAFWLSLAVWGLSAIGQSFHSLFLVIKWLGAAYLIFLAWKMWNAPCDLDQDKLPQRGSAIRSFASGMAITLGNPKIVLFYVALLPTIIDLQHPTILGWVELSTTLVLVLMTIDLVWVMMAARARKWLKNPNAIRIANRCSAGIMAGAATAIATR